jgi:LCP family protein required for cell wall assembly
MTPKHVRESSDIDLLSYGLGGSRGPSSFLLLFPGWIQLTVGRRVIGTLGVATTLTFASLIAYFAFLVLNDPDALLNLLTDSSRLEGLGIVIASLGVASFILGVIDIIEISRTRLKRTRRRLIPKVAYTVIYLTVTGLAVSLAFSQATLLRSVSAPDTGSNTQAGDETEPIEPLAGLDRVNVLLLGGDAGDGRIGLRPDSISILSVEVESGQVTIIGIPRNLQNAIFNQESPLYGPFPNGYDCGKSCLISYLYTYGINNPELYGSAEFVGRDPGVEATRDAVEGVTGLEIPYSVLLDMRGFERLVDAVGGVEVCVPVTTSTKDRSSTFVKGCQQMNGAQALAYSRIRSDSDDYNRMSKQRLVQTALLQQINPLDLLLGFQRIATTSGSYVKTDIPESHIGHLLKLALRASKVKSQTLELVPPSVDVTNPDFKAIRQMVRDIAKN